MELKRRRGVNVAAAVFLGALAVRLLNYFTLFGTPENFFIEDSMIYWQSALDWHGTGGFNFVRESLDGPLVVPMFERTPGYTVFLLGVRGAFGLSADAVVIVQCLLDSITCVFAYLIGRFYSESVGMVTGALTALQPNMIFHSAYILTDTVFLLLVTVTIWSFCVFLMQRRLASIGLAGLFLGASIAVRPVAQFAPPMLLFVLLVANYRFGQSIVRNLGLCVLFSAGVAVAVGPIIYRNLESFGSPRIAAQSGNHLMNWVLPLIVSFDGSKNYTEAAGEFNSAFKKKIEVRGHEFDSMNPFLRDNMVMTLSLQELSEMPPLRTAAAWVSGMAISWGAPSIIIEKRVRSTKHSSFSEQEGSVFERINAALFNTSPYALIVLTASILSVASIIFNLVGVRILATEQPLFCLLALGVILYFAILTGPVMSPKYRLPTEPVMAILSAIALVRIWVLLKMRVGFEEPRATN